MTTPVKKLTIKTCGDFSPAKIRALLLALGPWQGEGDARKQVAPEDGTAIDLIKIAGEATGAQTGQTDKGQYTKLTGSFIGTDLTTGELFSSKACILPEYIGSQLGDALLTAGDNGSSVQFAFQITAKQKASAITGYEFGIKSLMQSAPTDQQARLMALAGITAPAPKLKAPESIKPAGADTPDGKGAAGTETNPATGAAESNKASSVKPAKK
mgnify:FL=1